MKERESKKLPIAVRIAAAAFGTVAAGSFAGCDDIQPFESVFWGVCDEGQGVSEAADFVFVDDSHNKFVIIDMAGGDHYWTNEVPEKLYPQSVEDTEIVTCVSTIGSKTYQICEYQGGAPDVRMVKDGAHVQLREAKTGEKIASADFFGGEPGDCEEELSWGVTRVTGSEVTFERVWEWMKQFVE